jgi:hypothetical protein
MGVALPRVLVSMNRAGSRTGTAACDDVKLGILTVDSLRSEL